MANLAYMPASKLADLLRALDANKGIYAVLRDNQLTLGNDPFKPTALVDFSDEAIRPFNGPGLEHPGASPPQGPQSPLNSGAGSKSPRRSGDYWLEIKGYRLNCGSLKQLLAAALTALEEAVPGTLDKLSRVKGRSRHIVAREPGLLFNKRHLSEKYAEQLMPGWWFGTNNSAEQTQVWLKRACKLSSLTWGEDFRISLYDGLALDIDL
jgi:hypothetical protein